ncbi:E3 ubiquitin-protein ligase MARCHF5-like isoform X2 [Corticium candelabrum]|uniref:E3 ubiquitin-protein ligase MARCHF5-like isoform X2 n=1 Tax=Corticium candelabrum TaxID=121492 RepID=UPI002E26DAB4|nr:E3 ubiquitin-protein ligase MARCHF5-like isoform X2 [Corticium candelabrum]
MGSKPRRHSVSTASTPHHTHSKERIHQGRSCWVCFETDEDDAMAEWVHPCRCRGTTMWVHQECLQRWVDEKQNGSAATAVSCPQCRARYQIVSPPLNSFLQIIDETDKLADALSPLATAGTLVVCLYWCATSYGALVVWQVFLIGARFINWQLYGLQAWRRYWPIVKNLMGYQSNENEKRRRAPLRKPAQVNKPGADAVSLSRLIVGALTLPTCAAVVGYSLYGDVVTSNTTRAVLGGLTFVVVKGLLKMYYQEQQYIRQSKRRIRDYPVH